MQKIGQIGIWIFLIFMFLFQLTSQAQSNKKFEITGKIVPESGESGVGVIEVTKNGEKIPNIDIPKNGRFKFDLEFFNEYSLNFKFPGHFNKIIIVSTEIPQEVWKRDNDFPPFPMVVELLKEIEGIDKSFTLKPSGRIFYGKDIDNFQKESYTSDIQLVEQIETAKLKAVNVKKESQFISKENAQDLATKQKNFDQLVNEADAHYQRGEYQMALAKYLEAKTLFPEKSYPTDRVAELQDLVKALEITEKQKAELDKKYRNAIAKANGFFDQKNYQNALPVYKEAIQYKPEDVFANGRINEIDQLLALLDQQEKDKAQKEKEYQMLIAQADKLLDKKEYPNAQAEYRKALVIKAEDSYAKEQIRKIDDVFARQEAEAKTKADFNQAMAEGENLLKNKELAKAKNAFTKARNLIPSETLPPQRISEINTLLAEQTRKETELKGIREAYMEAIQRADKQFSNKEYKSAQLVYKEALLIKSDEKYPADQLALIEKLLKEQNEQNYKTSISIADEAFGLNQYDEATVSYQKALNYKKADLYATQQLKKIDQKKADIEAENNRLKKLDDQYNATISEANNDFSNKNYLTSKEKYQKALTLKPAEVFPNEQIAKIDQILNELRNADETNRQYAQLVKLAQDAFQANKLKEARDAYQDAANMKPDEPIPPLRIAEINTMLAQLEETAKLAAMEESQRLAKEKADREFYTNAIAAGDKSFAEKQYTIARSHYTTALTAKPNEKYPKDQIAKIDILLAQEEKDKALARRKSAQDSIQMVKDQAFDLAMSTAKEHEQNKRYLQAIEKYQDAITINPLQKSIIQKLIRDIEDKIQLFTKQETEYLRIIKLADGYFSEAKLNEALTEYRNASAIKTDEDYPKQQISKILSLLAASEQNYTNAITNADKAFDASEWLNAKTAYGEALTIKPKESYPTNRLKEVNQKIADANLAAISNLAQDKAYKDAMEKAEKSLKDEQFTSARMQFLTAQSLNPDEKLPAERIIEIDKLIEQRKKDQLAQSQQNIDERYRQAISVADNSFREKTYPNAKLQYKQASVIKPGESYPKNQIELIDKLMNESKSAETYASKLPETENANTVSKPIYNPTESARATEIRAQSFKPVADYNEAVKKADELFGVKDYAIARFYYYKANDIKPEEEYPINQIEPIRKLIDSELSAIDRSGYDQAITEADKAFSSKNYSIAKFFYYKALDIKSWEKYPKDRIEEILALTNSLLSEKEEKEYRDLINKADEAYFNKDIAIARFYYYKAISMKKDENYPRIKLKDIQKLIEQDQRDQQNQQYRKLIEEGEQALQSENFGIARFNYNKALSLKPDEKYPKDQLKRIKEALDKQNN